MTWAFQLWVIDTISSMKKIVSSRKIPLHVKVNAIRFCRKQNIYFVFQT